MVANLLLRTDYFLLSVFSMHHPMFISATHCPETNVRPPDGGLSSMGEVFHIKIAFIVPYNLGGWPILSKPSYFRGCPALLAFCARGRGF